MHLARLTVGPMSAAKSETWHACPTDKRIINLLLETSRRSLLPSPGDNFQRSSVDIHGMLEGYDASNLEVFQQLRLRIELLHFI